MNDKPKITQEEIQLVKKAKAGDMKAYNKLFKKYKRFVELILFKYLGDMDEAKDLTNVVFMKVYNKLSTFVSYDSFGGWLRIIANRTAIDYIRKNARYQSITKEQESLLESEEGGNENDIINNITYKKILKEFENLPEDTKTIFNMFYVDNHTIEEINKRTGMPIGTIKSILHRTRKQLQKKFKKQ